MFFLNSTKRSFLDETHGFSHLYPWPTRGHFSMRSMISLISLNGPKKQHRAITPLCNSSNLVPLLLLNVQLNSIIYFFVQILTVKSNTFLVRATWITKSGQPHLCILYDKLVSFIDIMQRRGKMIEMRSKNFLKKRSQNDKQHLIRNN